jgi:hypothetical protein
MGVMPGICVLTIIGEKSHPRRSPMIESVSRNTYRVTCDVCGKDATILADSWGELIQALKFKRWKFDKLGDEWLNFCCAECKAAYNKG